MNEHATVAQRADSFNANVTVAGAYVSIHATSLAALLKTLDQLTHAGATVPAVEKPAPKTEAPGKPTTAASAAVTAAPAQSTTAPSPGPAAASSADAAPKHDYKEIQAAVLALAKVDPAIAKKTLAKFTGQNGEPCDHGTKLKLEDYPAFLAQAKADLEAAKVPA